MLRSEPESLATSWIQGRILINTAIQLRSLTSTEENGNVVRIRPGPLSAACVLTVSRSLAPYAALRGGVGPYMVI